MSPEETTSKVMEYVKAMQDLNIAHNIFFSHTGAYIFPRQHQPANPDETKVNIATMEASGHMILKSEEHFNFTEEYLSDQIRGASLGSYDALLSRVHA